MADKPMTRQELAEQVDRIVVEALAYQQAFAKCDMASGCCPEPVSWEVTGKILQLFEDFSPFDLTLVKEEK